MHYKNGTEMHIETLIVLDYAMVKYHKDVDLENYILTVFNMVCLYLYYLGISNLQTTNFEEKIIRSRTRNAICSAIFKKIFLNTIT